MSIGDPGSSSFLSMVVKALLPPQHRIRRMLKVRGPGGVLGAMGVCRCVPCAYVCVRRYPKGENKKKMTFTQICAEEVIRL